MDLLLWLVAPSTAVLAWRLLSRRRVDIRKAVVERKEARSPRPGEDSEFYLIEQALGARGRTRHRAETLKQWIERVDATGKVGGTQEVLQSIIPTHYRYRFDPEGLSAKERADLRDSVQAWLDRHAGTPEH